MSERSYSHAIEPQPAELHHKTTTFLTIVTNETYYLQYKLECAEADEKANEGSKVTIVKDVFPWGLGLLIFLFVFF